ncbi:MAG: hypothetical protein ACK4P1_08645, partial [Aggregatilineales bacterium]
MPVASESEPKPTEAELSVAAPNGEAARQAASHAVAERDPQTELPPDGAPQPEAVAPTPVEAALE